jgi:phosphoribosylanthranilate isomerase
MGDPSIMQELAKIDVDMLGFIFYPKSPRYLVGKIEAEAITTLPQSISKVGVFVNAPTEDILTRASTYRLDTIQLHGSETASQCSELKKGGFTIIKAFDLNKDNNYEAYQPYCDYFLFDTPSKQHGGTGKKFDWSLLNNYKGDIPFLLSGGIDLNDTEEIIRLKHPQLAGVDINSKFEKEPGIKDVEKINSFVNAIKGKNE